MTTTTAELFRDFALALIAKSGVKEWQDSAQLSLIANAAMDLAIFAQSSGDGMTISNTLKQEVGTQLTFKSSGGDGAITMASLANGSYRQSVKIDLGATFALAYEVTAEVELAATPTAGNTCDLYWNPSSSAVAGTNEKGGCSGTDAAYTGYASNAVDSVKELILIGSLVNTANATTTVQKGFVGVFSPPNRYGSLVVKNGSGAAFHTSDANTVFKFTPLIGTVES